MFTDRQLHPVTQPRGLSAQLVALMSLKYLGDNTSQIFVSARTEPEFTIVCPKELTVKGGLQAALFSVESVVLEFQNMQNSLNTASFSTVKY